MLDKLNAWLNGKKTVLSVIGLVFTALATFATGLADGFQLSDLVDLVKNLSGALAVIGIGHKIVKAS